eukprot:SAG31_NODE_4665_length_3055_cov_1.841001_3_plen_392_part_00
MRIYGHGVWVQLILQKLLVHSGYTVDLPKLSKFRYPGAGYGIRTRYSCKFSGRALHDRRTAPVYEQSTSVNLWFCTEKCCGSGLRASANVCRRSRGRVYRLDHAVGAFRLLVDSVFCGNFDVVEEDPGDGRIVETNAIEKHSLRSTTQTGSRKTSNARQTIGHRRAARQKGNETSGCLWFHSSTVMIYVARCPAHAHRADVEIADRNVLHVRGRGNIRGRACAVVQIDLDTYRAQTRCGMLLHCGHALGATACPSARASPPFVEPVRFWYRTSLIPPPRPRAVFSRTCIHCMNSQGFQWLQHQKTRMCSSNGSTKEHWNDTITTSMGVGGSLALGISCDLGVLAPARQGHACTNRKICSVEHRVADRDVVHPARCLRADAHPVALSHATCK